SLARVGRPLAPAPPPSSRRRRHTREGGGAQADAVVSGARRRPPAPPPRGGSSGDRRPRGARRAARGRVEAEAVRIAVCAPQVPFVRGGAEIFAETLVDELRARDHETELVTVPFKWYPGTRVLDQAFLWRLLDLTESDGGAIDLVVATKFPSYCVRHPNKRVWVLHQFRQAYDLDRTDLGQFSEEPADRALRRSVQRLDGIALGEAKRLFATSRNVADRIERSTGLAPEVLPHPPQELPYRCEEYGDFVLSVNRLDRAKRIDLLLEAAALDPSLRVVVTVDGPDRERLEALARERGLDGRGRFGARAR